MRWMYIAAAATTLICAFAAARVTFSRPIGFDEAYNLQIAKSISTNFCYCTRYRPERVFPVEESTNGVAQYVAASFFALTGSADDAKAGTVAVAVLVLGAVLLLLDPWLVFLSVFLYFVWPWFHVTVTSFVGEIFAIAFSLLGLSLLRRKAAPIAVVCFAVAVESKLVSILVILPAVWAILYTQHDSVSLGNRAYRATRGSLIIGAGTALGLFLLVAFSIVHSTRSLHIATIWQTYSGYILDMIAQGQRAPGSTDLWHVAQAIFQFDSLIVLALFVVSAALLLCANPGNAFLLLTTFIWWLYFGKTERHLVISFFATLVLAGVEGRALLERTASRLGLSGFPLLLASLGALAAVCIVVSLATHNTFSMVALKRFPDREHVVSTSAGKMTYSKRIVAVLRGHPYVLTSGWWQMPEISLRENLEFYDRMSPSNANIPRSGAVLFFDKGNRWSPTTAVNGNCDRVLYIEGPLVICTPKRDEPLAFQPRASS